MTKFVISSQVPDVLSSYEMRIDLPNMLQEVTNCWSYRPASGQTGANWLRQIANEITKWDKNFNPYKHIVPSDYQGVPFSTPEEVAEICLRMVKDRYSSLNDSWVEHCIRHKPPFTKLIWFTGDFKTSSKFTSNFIDRIEISEVDEWLGRHKSKAQVKITPTTTAVGYTESGEEKSYEVAEINLLDEPIRPAKESVKAKTSKSVAPKKTEAKVNDEDLENILDSLS
jgi:hypothetical protein